MQTPALVLNIGADVAKDEIVAACSEGSFPVRKVANQRAAVLAFLKGLAALDAISHCSFPAQRDAEEPIAGVASPCRPRPAHEVV